MNSQLISAIFPLVQPLISLLNLIFLLFLCDKICLNSMRNNAIVVLVSFLVYFKWGNFHFLPWALGFLHLVGKDLFISENPLQNAIGSSLLVSYGQFDNLIWQAKVLHILVDMSTMNYQVILKNRVLWYK